MSGDVDLSPKAAAELVFDDEAAPEQEGEVIIITGSSIERRDLTTPAPVAVVDKEELEASGLVSVGDILQNLPSQSNAINVQVNNGGDGSTRVNLRGLEVERTLVLVNGRRHVPGGNGANSSVDLSAIPIAIIERVEVLKDGASAIYGSDAIGGVVNIITRSDFKGTETGAYIGTTGDGLGTVYDLSLVTGQSTRRGNVVFSAGYYQQYDMGASERDFSKADLNYNWMTGEVTTAGSSTTPEGSVIVAANDNVPGNAEWERIRRETCPSGDCFNDPEAGWRDFDSSGNRDVDEGDLYNFQPENYLITPQQRYNIFSTGSYQLHERVRTFFEASYTNRQSDQQLAPEPLSTAREGLTVSADNIYNPFGRDFSAADGADVQRRLVEFGRRRFIQDVDTFRFVGGLDGKLPEELQGWRWSLALNYGRTEATQINQGRLIRSRLASAIGPSFRDEDGVARCGTIDAPIADCVPLNLFGGAADPITPEMRRYLTYTGIAKGYNEQTSLLLNTTGRLFKTPWGGDVALAVGAEYRSESGANIPDPRTAVGDTTGNKTEPTEGGFDVYESFAELSVVPVVGKQLAEWVELTGAARVFHYVTPTYNAEGEREENTNTDFTWKLGGLWRMIQGVSVRGTYSTAFRAPSINELFSGEADAFPRVSDPCDTTMGRANPVVDANCRADGIPDDFQDSDAQLPTRIGGYPNLEPETAKIFTVGAVYEPTFLPGLALTVDYFNTKIENAIQPAGASVILANCYAQTDRTDCDKITRNPASNRITRIDNRETNIGGAETAGVDFSIRYDHLTPAGRFRYSLEGTWLQNYDEIQGSGANARRVKGKNVYDLGLYPDWKLNVATVWGLREWGAGLNLRFINGIKECQNNNCNTEGMEAASRDVSANVTADLFGSYNLKSAAGLSRVTVGINNVLNQKPATIYNGLLANSDTDYDFLGRFFYTRFTQQF